MTIESSNMPFGIIAGAYSLGLEKIGSVYDVTAGIRASGLGMCARRQLYKLVEFPKSDMEPTSFKSLASMRFGTVIGDDIENLVSDMVNTMSALDGNEWKCIPQLELVTTMNYGGTEVDLVAHPDILLVRCEGSTIKHIHVVDIKTTNPFGHKRQVSQGGSPHHMYQVGMAMFMLPHMVAETLLFEHLGIEDLEFDQDMKVTGELFYISRADGDNFSVEVPYEYAERAENRCADIMEMIHDRKDPGAVPLESWECNYCDFKPGCHFNNHNPFAFPFTADASITKDQ